VVNVDAHLKIAAAHLVTLISSKILPANEVRRRKRRLLGTAVPTTLMTSMQSTSTLPLAGLPTPTGQADQNPSSHSRTRRNPGLSEIAKVRIIKTSWRDVLPSDGVFPTIYAVPVAQAQAIGKDPDFKTINEEEARRVLSLELFAGSLTAHQN
jgi:hypothetical protein